jgi:hypothetical protein
MTCDYVSYVNRCALEIVHPLKHLNLFLIYLYWRLKMGVLNKGKLQPSPPNCSA